MFIVQELLICTNDGTGEANIIGVFNSKEKAQEALKNRVLEQVEFCGIELFNQCDMTGPQDILEMLKEKFTNVKEKMYVILDEKYAFVAGHEECWHEYYLELSIEEKDLKD